MFIANMEIGLQKYINTYIFLKFDGCFKVFAAHPLYNVPITYGR